MRNGSWAKNSRCWSGMKSRMTLLPTCASRRRTPARSCIACSPGWKGEASGDVARSDLTSLLMVSVLRWLPGNMIILSPEQNGCH